MDMLMRLTNEQLIKIAAPEYVGEVTPADIDQALRGIAGGESETISESEFKEWYRQLLNQVDLSDSEYKEIIATGLLRARLHEYLAARMPTVAEQIHLHVIILEAYEDAEKIRARWEAGEDFADLAREISLDEVSGEKGGDLGWLPRGVLASSWFDEVAFSLTVGDVSEPLSYMSDPETEEIFYYLLMVSEKAEAREIDEESLRILRDQVLDAWLLAEIKFHEVEWDYNSEINAWIHWQLSK
jgi:parvulin-like peptidyl-prolyl isomerase